MQQSVHARKGINGILPVEVLPLAPAAVAGGVALASPASSDARAFRTDATGDVPGVFSSPRTFRDHGFDSGLS